MSLFNRKRDKKSEECKCGESCSCKNGDDSSCCCKEGSTRDGMAPVSIKILGYGCQKCDDLMKSAKEALLELGMDESIEHVTDLVEIASYGVMSTPALVIDSKVVSLGKVLKKDEVIELIKKARE